MEGGSPHPRAWASPVVRAPGGAAGVEAGLRGPRRGGRRDAGAHACPSLLGPGSHSSEPQLGFLGVHGPCGTVAGSSRFTDWNIPSAHAAWTLAPSAWPLGSWLQGSCARALAGRLRKTGTVSPAARGQTDGPAERPRAMTSRLWARVPPLERRRLPSGQGGRSPHSRGRSEQRLTHSAPRACGPLLQTADTSQAFCAAHPGKRLMFVVSFKA